MFIRFQGRLLSPAVSKPVKGSAGCTFVRSASRFTNSPMRFSDFLYCCRPAIEVPTHISCRPLYRYNKTSKAASSGHEQGGFLLPAQFSLAASLSCLSILNSGSRFRVLPCTGGRGKSVGNSSQATPCNFSFQ